MGKYLIGKGGINASFRIFCFLCHLEFPKNVLRLTQFLFLSDPHLFNMSKFRKRAWRLILTASTTPFDVVGLALQHQGHRFDQLTLGPYSGCPYSHHAKIIL